MKHLLLRCALVACSTFAATAQAVPTTYTDPDAFALAVASLTIEDFESPPWIADTNYGAPVTSLGINWSAANTLRATTFMPHSGRVALSDLDGSPDQLDALTAQLPAGVTALGLWLRSTQNLVNVEFSLYSDVGGPLMNFTQTFFDTWTFIGFTSDTPLGRLQLRATRDGGVYVDDFIVDDVAFGARTAPSVPEPASTALIAAALAPLLVRRRQRGE